MARPSKLTPTQWGEIERRFLVGESASALGREFGVSEAGIRKKFGSSYAVSSNGSKVREVALKLADANSALQALPPAHRGVAIDLSEKLRSISMSVASAAELGAKTGHRLHALANTEVGKVDDSNVLSEDSITALKSVGVLTKLANESLMPALNLLAANKDRMREANEANDGAPPMVELTDSQLATFATASSH